MRKLILIRHGETDYTAQRRYCGHSCTPLNSEGIEQANRLRARLKNIKVDKIYSSDLKRSFQTAKIIFPDRIIYKKKGVREIDFGKFVGFTWEESSRLYPGIYKTWLSNPIDTKIPGGETVLEFAKRVEKCFVNIFKQNSNKALVLVTHGGPIRVILLKILNQGFDQFWNIEQNTTSVNLITFRKGIPQVSKINDTSHLE